MHKMIAIPLASLAVGALIGWCAKVFADAGIICDAAGNSVDPEADTAPLLPDPHTDLIVNTMSPLGFLAVQLRLSGDYANDRGILDDAGRALDASVESLKKDLTPCADCGQIKGSTACDVVLVFAVRWMRMALTEACADVIIFGKIPHDDPAIISIVVENQLIFRHLLPFPLLANPS